MAAQRRPTQRKQGHQSAKCERGKPLHYKEMEKINSALSDSHCETLIREARRTRNGLHLRTNRALGAGQTAYSSGRSDCSLQRNLSTPGIRATFRVIFGSDSGDRSPQRLDRNVLFHQQANFIRLAALPHRPNTFESWAGASLPYCLL